MRIPNITTCPDRDLLVFGFGFGDANCERGRRTRSAISFNVTYNAVTIIDASVARTLQYGYGTTPKRTERRIMPILRGSHHRVSIEIWKTNRQPRFGTRRKPMMIMMCSSTPDPFRRRGWHSFFFTSVAFRPDTTSNEKAAIFMSTDARSVGC